MKRLRVMFIWFTLIFGVVVGGYILVRVLAGDNHPASVLHVNAVRVVPERPRTVEVETRTRVCNGKEVGNQAEPIGVKFAHDHEVFLTAPSTEQHPRYCLGQEVAVGRRLKLPGPASRFVFYDAGTSPPTRLELSGSPSSAP